MLLVVCGFTSRRGNTQAFALMAGTSTAYRVAAFIGRSSRSGTHRAELVGILQCPQGPLDYAPESGHTSCGRGDTGSPE